MFKLPLMRQTLFDFDMLLPWNLFFFFYFFYGEPCNTRLLRLCQVKSR